MVQQPLENIKVVDCASLYAGPLTAMFMGDFGADVIKIEHPEFGDAIRDYGPFEEDLTWRWVARNKKSVPLDLHDEEAQEIFKEIVSDADVLIENFRPGTLERWGLGWETLSDHNPDLVMVRATGFGQYGPYKDRPGFGTLAEAMSGFAYVTGQPDGPPTLPALGLADSVAALYSTFAAMFALYWRDVEGGTGQYIDTSIVEPLFAIMGEYTVDYSVKNYVHERKGNRSPHTAPRNTYQTKDDRWVAISGSAESIAQRVLHIVGGEEMANDPRFQTMKDRLEHVEELDERIQAWMGERTRDEVIDVFEEHDAAAAPVYNTEDIFRDPHFDKRDAIVEVEDEQLGEYEMAGVFPKLSETPGDITHPGPVLGAHTLEVLQSETPMTEQEIRGLADRGVTTIADE
jgi:formyl-CoA transferase